MMRPTTIPTGAALLATPAVAQTAGAMKLLKIVAPMPDRVAALKVRGQSRVFHRCPASALKAPEGQADH